MSSSVPKNILSIIPITLNILVKQFPHVVYAMTLAFVLATKKSRVNKFRIKSFTNELFDALLAAATVDYVGDRKSCCLLSLNSLHILGSSTESWIRVCRDGEDRGGGGGECDDIKWNSVMPEVPGGGRRLDSSDSLNETYRLIQCLTTSSLTEDHTLYVTEDLHHNIKQSLGFGVTENCEQVCVHNVDKKFGFAEIAESAIVVPIISSFEMLQEDFDELLQTFFKKPRYLIKGDVFSILLKEEVPHFLYTAAYHDIREISFKVVDLRSPHASDLGYYVVKNHTSVFLNPGIAGYLPSRTLRCTSGTPHLDLPRCPHGLTSHGAQLLSILRVFQRGRHPDMKPFILVRGPRGCGKKTVVFSSSDAAGMHIYKIDCFDFYGVGASIAEAKMDVVLAKVKKGAPCVLMLLNVEVSSKSFVQQNSQSIVGLRGLVVSGTQSTWLKPVLTEVGPSSYPTGLTLHAQSSLDEALRAGKEVLTSQ